jgi:hypothetical protein
MVKRRVFYLKPVLTVIDVRIMRLFGCFVRCEVVMNLRVVFILVLSVVIGGGRIKNPGKPYILINQY